MPSEEDLKALFTYQPPTRAQEAQYHELFTPARILAQTFAKHCTPSAALDFAIHQIYAACWIAVGVVAAAPAEELEETELSPEAGAQPDAPGALTPEGAEWERMQAEASQAADAAYRAKMEAPKGGDTNDSAPSVLVAVPLHGGEPLVLGEDPPETPATEPPPVTSLEV